MKIFARASVLMFGYVLRFLTNKIISIYNKNILYVIIFSFIIISPVCIWGSIDEPEGFLVAEYEGNATFGLKLYVFPHLPEKNFGGFLGFKFSAYRPKGKKYNWSQSRAEEFYDSEFRGYSKKVLYGGNIGAAYLMFKRTLYVYSGIGFTISNQYRQYYDDTFTKWSNDYYIDDNKIKEIRFDVVVGGNLVIDRYTFGLGYSVASSNPVISLGIMF